MQHPEGDRALSAKYFKAAGFASGKYEGGETLLLVSDNAEPDKSIAQIAERQLNEMGFKTKLRLVTRDTMLTRFCQVPRSEVERLPVVRLGAGLLRPADRARPDVQRREHPPGLELELVRARRHDRERGDRQGEADVEPGERAEAWAEVNKVIVAQAPAIPYMWDYQSVGRVAERARRAERLLDDLGLELHVPAVRS